MSINNRHISGQYDSELDSLFNDVLAMGRLVENQLTDAILALNSLNTELADQVIVNDHQVNNYEVSIDLQSTQIIVKRQPAAGDLRLILSIAKTAGDLERIGDNAKKLANVTLEKKSNQQGPLLVSLESLGRHCVLLLNQALDCFAAMDVEAAFELHTKDRDVDLKYESMIRELMTYMMEDPRSIPHVMEVMWAARALERVGDRIQNIAEYVIYNVKGKDVRHFTQEQMAHLND